MEIYKIRNTPLSKTAKLFLSGKDTFPVLLIIMTSLFTNGVSSTTTPFPVTSSSSFELPVNLTIVSIEPAEGPFTFIFPKSQPVLEIAVDYVNELYEGRFNFHFVNALGSCTRGVVGVAAAKISCEHNISVFVGPACSKAAETIGYMANDWNVPLITPVANTQNIGDKETFKRLTRINPFMQSSIVETVFYLMEKYQWKHAVFFYDTAIMTLGLLGETFISSFKESVFSWNNYPLDGSIQTRSDYRIWLKDAALRSRVFLLFMQGDTLTDFLLEANDLGYTSSKEFVFIVALSLATVPRDENTWQRGLDSDEKIRDSLGHVLFLHIDDSRIQLPANVSAELRKRSLEKYGYDYGTDEPAKTLAIYYDAVLIYATAVNDTLSEGGSPYDGLAITKRIWNRTFYGMSGRVDVNAIGDRFSNVTISALDPTTRMMREYAAFDSKRKNLMMLGGASSFPWPLNKGEPPPGEPVCGFTGVLCSITEDSTLIGGLGGFFGVAVVISGLVALVMYRRWKKQSEKDLWWWRIESQDFNMLDRKAGQSVLSFTSKASLRGSTLDCDSVAGRDCLLAVYKGQMVRLRSLAIKQLKITNETLQDFNVVRELSHNNLVRIFGACLEERTKLLVIEHCNKGSLQDLLGNTNVKLDAQFKFSLCTDIINGLCYLHERPVKCHGRLNSEVCVVDNRFSVKLADFGLPSLYSAIAQDVHSQEYKNCSLWKAPEIIRSGDMKGTREADIYSFAIILSEVVTRDCPYGNEILYLTNEEILEKIREVSNPPFRPIVEVPIKMADMKDLMERCWAENPKDRPTAQTIKSAIKKIALSLGETGNLLDNLMRRMELYANNLEKLVEDKTVELREEKKKSEELLYQILPRSVADRLKAGLRVEPESYECVTIYFSDIVGFTTISAAATPIQVVDLLNDLYSCFDATIGEFDVYKVETIGDAYMVVSGLPQRNGNMHVVHIARMSLKLLTAISQFKIRHLTKERMRLRIGLHSGPVCAGVVGLKMPRYCLFGDTVNTASRMESHGEAMMIHLSASTKAILDQFCTFETTPRGNINIKGKGTMLTYWLMRENSPNVNL